jgi:hypothetical protein
VLEGLRFAVYRAALGAAMLSSFRSQRVTPVGTPVPATPGTRPFPVAFPGMPVPDLLDPIDLPAADAARLRRIETSARLLGVVDRIAPARTPPVPVGEDAYLKAIYTRLLRRAWPTGPSVPPELRGDPGRQPVDVPARLAVRGPFASYLRADARESDTYVLDVSWLLGYPVRPGLLAPGGAAVLRAEGWSLRTVRISRGGAGVTPAPWRGRLLEQDALLAGLNEDLTTFRHNVGVHLAVMTPFAIASIRRLDVDHPIRRLLHHCFHTVLVGNHELGSLQLGGPRGFATKVFSHDAPTVARMATDYLARFDFWDFEPPRQFASRGTTTTPFAYPYRDNVMELWHLTRGYAEDYLRLYLDDGSLSSDASVGAWLDDLDDLLPNGIRRAEQPVDVTWLARACATVIHLSTVEHDVLNNLAWDYCTPGWLVPTVVPLNGERMDQRRAFDLVATLIGTWKPYNMLLQTDLAEIANDGRGAVVMRRWLDGLGAVQRAMEARGADPGLVYPANLNVSVSN